MKKISFQLIIALFIFSSFNLSAEKSLHALTLDEAKAHYLLEVIKHIESYDTTTVRASVGNWLICKFIKEQSNAKVIFNGDGSDEVTGGYMYFHYAPNEIEFDRECKRLLKDIHYFDVLRSDKSISSNGLEARTPFLDYGLYLTTARCCWCTGIICD